jgi:hypothetical protein
MTFLADCLLRRLQSVLIHHIHWAGGEPMHMTDWLPVIRWHSKEFFSGFREGKAFLALSSWTDFSLRYKGHDFSLNACPESS